MREAMLRRGAPEKSVRGLSIAAGAAAVSVLIGSPVENAAG
jgi:hypothetical protein